MKKFDMVLNKLNIKDYIKDACKIQGIKDVKIYEADIVDSAMLSYPKKNMIYIDFNKIFENPDTIMGLIWHEIGHMVLHKNVKKEYACNFKGMMKYEYEATEWAMKYAIRIEDKDLYEDCRSLLNTLKEGEKKENKRIKTMNSVIEYLLSKGFEFGISDTYCKNGIVVKIETVDNYTDNSKNK